MTSRYRFQFPIGIHFYKWGFTTWLQPPIVREYIAPPSDRDEGGISIFLGVFDEDD
jgi:hypothetical protein